MENRIELNTTYTDVDYKHLLSIQGALMKVICKWEENHPIDYEFSFYKSEKVYCLELITYT